MKKTKSKKSEKYPFILLQIADTTCQQALSYDFQVRTSMVYKHIISLEVHLIQRQI